MSDGHQGVGGFAGLADRYYEGALINDRVAIAELAGEFDFAGDSGPVLDCILGHEPRVERGAARHNDDLVDLAQLVLGDPYLVQGEPVIRVMASKT